jgi:formylglycine-generating enzyme required for sulfatase activity
MGSATGDSDEKPAHRVALTRDFELGKYEVTQAQWAQVKGTRPSYSSACGGACPAEQVSWEDVLAFIARLNARKDGYTYRLPTEAEWEYAARGGTNGDYAGNLDEMAWYEKNSDDTPHVVGQKRPNARGVYDMHGNVWEWVSDWIDIPPGSPPATCRWPSRIQGSRRLASSVSQASPGPSA